MGRKNKNIVLNEVEILDVGAEGKAVGRFENQVVFVKNAVPGDVVDVRVHKKRKKYMEGIPLHFHKYSEKRVEPICKHFGVCGGCKWQSLSYQDQLSFKQNQIVRNFEKIGKVKDFEVTDICGSTEEYFYRNKLEFTFSNNRWLTQDEVESGDSFTQKNALGFHIPQRFDKILDIETCYLQKDPSNGIRNFVREYAKENKLTFFDLKNQEGLLRNLIIRTTSTGEIMVILSFYYEDKKARENLLENLGSKFPEITSLMYVINPKGNDTISDLEVKTFKGTGHIVEIMDGLSFKISPVSFYQTNSKQAQTLYQITREYAELNGSQIVYDLYTGTGTIANYVAKQSEKVVGIEYIESAIRDARINSSINNITNTSFFAGDIKDILTPDFFENNGSPEVVIFDPPRAGIHPAVIERVLAVKPEVIVYVSCNPSTQARDIELMSEFYSLKKIQPVDMFPQTHHVENIAQLKLKNLN